MSGLRGIGYDLAAALVAGLVMGFVLFIMINSAANMEFTKELYLADTASLDLLYHGRNMEEYLKLGEREAIRDFVESGGPTDCGTVGFGGREVAVWRANGCAVQDPEDDAEAHAGRLAAGETRRYAGVWGVEVSSSGADFCMSVEADLRFSDYGSRVCFRSPLVPELRRKLSAMDRAFRDREGTRACLEGGDAVYWTDIDGYNFTYAIGDGCA